MLLVLLAFMPAAFSQSEWIPKKSNRLVNDYSHILTESQLTTLEQRLVAFNDSTSNQIVIIITPTLYGGEAINVATRIGHEWGVGQKKFSNGVVILIKSKSKREPDGDIAIATGYGVEGALPDAFCKRIIDDKMIEPLKKGKYYEALVEALDIIEPVLRGEYNFEKYKSDERTSALIGLLILFGIFGLPMLALWIYYKKHPEAFKNNGGNNRSGGSTGGHISSYPWFMGGGSSHRSGGGFGGFGGGGFGGGGASGKF